MSTPRLDPFASARAKLRRGDEHVDALDQSILDWSKPESGRLLGDFNSEPVTIRDATGQPVRFQPRTVFLLTFEYVVQPDFERWAVMTGDCLSNYRSALDHLVYGLASTSNDDPPPKAHLLQFPIADTSKDWDRAIKRDRLHGLSDGVVAEVKAAQPCCRSDKAGRLLARLRDLNDSDKHRVLNFSVLGYTPERLKFGPFKGPFEVVMPPGPLHDGAGVGIIRFAEPQPQMDMKVDTRLSMAIRLGDVAPGGPSVANEMEIIGNEVRRIVDLLAS